VAEVASAFISLKASARGFGNDIESQIGGDVDRVGRSSGRRMGLGLGAGMAGMGRSIFGPLAAMAGAMVVGDFLKDAVGEARESQKVGALTEQVIKTTGSAAKITAGQVGDLATSISNKTGIDDEAIQSASNLLLTFTGVRNEVGKGNDIFSQATAISADMGAVMGTDAKSSAIQLGKALNDPIKGVGALSRVGVSFTAQQKAQIKTMVKSGDTLGAQKIILAELGKEFGGAAAASATAGEKFSTTFGNFKESIGTALLPILDVILGKAGEFFGFLTTNVGPAVGKLGDAFKFLFEDGADGAQSFGEIVDNIFGNSGKLVGPMRIVGQVIKDVINGFKAMFLAFQDGDVTSDGIVGMFEQIGVFARDAVAFITGTVVPAVQGLFASFQSNGGPSAITASFGGLVTFFRGQVVPAVMAIVTAIRGFIAVALPIVVAFVTGMMARIRPMIPTIRAIFAQIGQVIVSVMGLIQAVIQRVTTVIAFVWKRWGGDIMNFIAGVWSKILVVIGAALRVIQAVIKTVTSVIKGDWAGAWAGVKTILSSAWDLIKSIVSAALTVIKGVMSGAWTVMKLALSTAWSGMKSVISSAWDGIKTAVSTKAGELVSFVGSIPGRILSAIGNLGSLLSGVGSSIIQGLISGITSKFEEVKATLSGLTDLLPDWKGPMSLDRKILRPSGQAVVGGFVLGLEDQYGSVERSLSRLTGSLVPRVGSLDFASSAERAGAVGGAGSGATSADIQALGDRIGAELDRQARTIQTMQRQMAGA